MNQRKGVNMSPRKHEKEGVTWHIVWQLKKKLQTYSDGATCPAFRISGKTTREIANKRFERMVSMEYACQVRKESVTREPGRGRVTTMIITSGHKWVHGLTPKGQI